MQKPEIKWPEMFIIFIQIGISLAFVYVFVVVGEWLSSKFEVFLWPSLKQAFKHYHDVIDIIRRDNGDFIALAKDFGGIASVLTLILSGVGLLAFFNTRKDKAPTRWPRMEILAFLAVLILFSGVTFLISR